jgi:hypothetical protein
MCYKYIANFKLIRHPEGETTGVAVQKFRVEEQTVRGWMKEKKILS